MCRQPAEQISKIPERFDAGNKSTARLLKEARFPQRRSDLSVEEVEDVFRQSPGLTDQWLRRGSEQRFAGGWGIERENGTYRVQCFADGHSEIEHDRLRHAHCLSFDMCISSATFLLGRYKPEASDAAEPRGSDAWLRYLRRNHQIEVLAD